ncbi:hypothetical protein V5799_019204 [Amblyomma americanum]|uniref:Uncharacterized protein n=1 Tax=Amblyomma americanum TaxID=6943 RepID=A0AAQ4EXJ1_AMBAM
MLALRSRDPVNPVESVPEAMVPTEDISSAPRELAVPESPPPAAPTVGVVSERSRRFVEYASVGILFFINLINYMDRYTVAVGSLEKVYSRVAVRLVDEAVVLPWSEHILYAFVPSDVESGAVGVLEPVDSLSNGLKAAACLVTVNDAHRVPLRVVNCSQQPLSLPKNKTFAFFTSAIEKREPTDTVLATVEHASPSAAPKVSFDLSHVKSSEREALAGLLNDYSEVFAASNLDLGCCGVIKHRIETGTSSPVYQRAYRIPYSQREEMERQVQDLIDRGIVEHSKSPWGAPALLVEKPDGSYRLVVDYRELNAVTRIYPYPIPNIQETLSQLGSARAL